MKFNKDFINYITNDDEDKLKLSHIMDLFFSSQQDNYVKNTNFLTPTQQDLLNKFPQDIAKSFFLFGGYEEAERKVLMLLPDYLSQNDIANNMEAYSPLTLLRVNLPKFYRHSLSHRDYLGSLMGLNIKREMIGDIIVHDEGADIIIMSSIYNFLNENLKQIGRVGIELKQLSSVAELHAPANKVSEKIVILSSFRIDNFISTAFNLSREMSKNFIDVKLVSINGSIVQKYTKLVNLGDIVTLRKYGRIKIISEVGKTKKDNIILKLLIYK